MDNISRKLESSERKGPAPAAPAAPPAPVAPVAEIAPAVKTIIVDVFAYASLLLL